MSDLRDDPTLRDGEQRAIEALQQAAADAAAVSPFATARAARALEAALDGDARARARWTTTRVAAVALIAAASAGVIAFQVARPASAVASMSPSVSSPSVSSPSVSSLSLSSASLSSAAVSAGSAGSSSPSSSSPSSSSAPGVTAPTVALSAPELAPVAADDVAPAKRVRRTPVSESERLLAAGEPAGAARVLARAPESAGVAAALALLARRHPEALTAVDAELALARGTDVMRLRCQHRLLHARDQLAMDACRAFGQEHPQDPAARLLSFAAGRLAEDLGDLAWAEEEYSRALLLSPFAGLSGTDALLARARVRFAAGDADEARADLRLYLHSEPAARREPNVAKLATSLGL